MEKKIRLGIIGVGNMGTAHFNNIKSGRCPQIEVTAVADINPERLQNIKNNADKEMFFYSDAIEMLDSNNIDAVIVSVPHYDHPKYAMECFKRNLPVMVEKPAGVYTKQVKEMNEAAEKSNSIFGMMFNQRTDHIYRKMKEITESKILGEIKRTNWIVTDWYRPQAYYNSGQWRATWSGEGGGVLLNQCPHNLDLWQWICGMPVAVKSNMFFGKWHDIEVEDDVTTFVEYANGATGVFVTTTGDTPGTNRFEITFEKGKLLATPGKLEMWELEVSEPEWSATNEIPFGTPKCTYSEVETDGENPQHPGVLNAFADTILNGGKLVAEGKEGINGLTLSNAMHLSAWMGQTVNIPFDEELYYNELMKRVRNSRIKGNTISVISDLSDTY